jgi:hypothetical protein
LKEKILKRSQRGAKPPNMLIESLRGTKSLQEKPLPLSFEGEGD